MDEPKQGSVSPAIREVAVLQESTEMILSSRDVDTALHHILLIVRNHFGATNCAVFLVDSGTNELYCRAQNGYPEEQLRAFRAKIGKEGIIGWVAENKTPLYVPDVSKEPRYIKVDPTLQSEIALPLLVRDEVIGVLATGSVHPDYFSDAMIGLLALFAGQAAVALENARLYTSERRRMRQIELINLIARSATSANDMEQLTQTFAGLIEDTFDGCDVCILLRDPDGKLTVRASAGDAPAQADNFLASERGGILAQAFSARSVVVANDLVGRRGWPACFPETGSEMCIPLLSLGESLGAIVLASAAPQYFSSPDRSIAQAAADVCATAIRSLQLGEEMRRVSSLDSVTGVYNQRYFHVLAAQEAQRSRRYRKTFSLLMVTLEIQKRRYSPDSATWNRAMRETAMFLKTQVRTTDSVCRYGPDRFAILLPETSEEGLGVVRTKLQTAFSDNHKGESLPLRPHFAAVTYPQDGANELELVRVLLERAEGSGKAASSA